ncbi:YceI family protein [Sulfurovum sp.]|uniref:YceI family protein n=1 Tax=Sulfurovum sp. TaxID=1969726 RepID=UPI0025FC3F4A|nr:YceI family protein [Sulfurovum sp.]
MKKTFLALLASLSLATAALAATGCVLVQPDDINVTWKAYKTPAKIGVAGQFTSVVYTPASLEGKNFRELFVGSSVKIDTNKITTGNPGRDAKLVKFFFGLMKPHTIEAKIVDIRHSGKHEKGKPRRGTVTAEVTMNGKTRTVPMSYVYNEGKFHATGTIDLFDFAAQKALASINKACYTLHKGKTWNDVTISFSTTVKATLCHINIARKQ